MDSLSSSFRGALLVSGMLLAFAGAGMTQAPLPPLKLMDQTAQSAEARNVDPNPAPQIVEVRKGGLALTITRTSPPGVEPGSYQLDLANDEKEGALSGVESKIGDREARTLTPAGGKVRWFESGASGTAVRVVATVASTYRLLSFMKGDTTLTATLPGLRRQDALGAGLPDGLTFKSWYAESFLEGRSNGFYRFRFTLEGDAAALDRVESVEYRLPKNVFSADNTFVTRRDTNFKVEQGTLVRGWSTEAEIRFKDGSRSVVSLPFAPTR